MSARGTAVRRAGSVACLALATVLWWPGPAGAEGDAAAGWWYRYSGASEEPTAGEGSQGGGSTGSPPSTLPPSPAPLPTIPGGEEPPVVPAPVPPPATVPAGGLYVANDSFGPVALGAIRFPVGQVGEATLTLRFADGAAAAGLPIVACPVLEGFQPASNGAWRDRPAHDCARAQSGGTIGADGSLTFILSDAFQLGGQETLDVLVLPEPGSGTPFSAPFEAVTAESLSVRSAAPARPIDPNVPSPSPAPASAGAPSPSPAPSSAPAPRPSTAAPRPATSPGSPPVAGSPAPAPSSGAVAPTAADAPVPVVDVFDDKPWARVLATVLLGLLAVGMAASTSGRLRMAVPALRGVGDARPRGVGRFARDRSGAPTALS